MIEAQKNSRIIYSFKERMAFGCLSVFLDGRNANKHLRDDLADQGVTYLGLGT